MEINARKEKGIQIVSVKGRIDAITAPEFENNLSELISKGARTFLIDLSGLEYISSAGLRSILTGAKKLKEEKGELCFTGLQGPVEEVFKISGFHSIFKIFESEIVALNSLSNA
jgi:anti-anti-sigma factor